MGMCPPSLPLLLAHTKPLHLCSIMLRMMSLVVAMQLWDLCTKVGGDKWGGERCSLLLLVMMILLMVVDVDVMVVVVLQKCQIIKDGGETGHQTCGCCLKMIQARLGHSLHVETSNKQRILRAEELGAIFAAP